MFNFRKKTLPVREDQARWIDQSFDLLESLFGKEWVQKAPLVLPNGESFPRPWEETHDWAAYALQRTCELMKVDHNRIRLEFMEDPWADLRKSSIPLGDTKSAGGFYHEIPRDYGPSHALIYINETMLKSPERMVATMSHELAHVLLLGDKKIPRDLDRMEP